MEIKIKSITDVITNSSSEVFICKIFDLEEAKKELYENEGLWTGEYDHTTWEMIGRGKNFFDTEIDYLRTIDDVEALYKKFHNCEIFRKYSSTILSLLQPYKLPESIINILKEFNHTDEEIKAFIDRKEALRKEIRDSSKIIQTNLVGQAVHEAWDNYRWKEAMKIIVDWMIEHNKPIKYFYD